MRSAIAAPGWAGGAALSSVAAGCAIDVSAQSMAKVPIASRGTGPCPGDKSPHGFITGADCYLERAGGSAETPRTASQPQFHSV